MNKSRLFFLLMFFVSTLFYGCATIVSGKFQSVTFNSNPSGAEITIGGRVLGTTPLTVTLQREQSDEFAIAKKEGYADQQFMVHSTVNPWFWGNILIGGLIGSSTDFVSGSAFEYEPGSYFLTLTPEKASQQERKHLEKTMWARNFILAGYSNLAGDLARGEGEYLSSLSSMLGIEETHKEAKLRQLRDLFSRHQEIPAFAEAVLDHFPINGASCCIFPLIARSE